jgi:hypothetical protein
VALNKRGRYVLLRHRHFTHEEALEFSKFKSLKYNEVRRMTASRQLFYWRFKTFNPDLTPGTKRFELAFRQKVFDWYKKKDLTTFDLHMKRVISPWDWVDKVAYSLPEELRYTKGGRRKAAVIGGEKETPAKRAERMKWIHQLKDTLAREPRRAGQLVPQILRLGGKVPPVAMRKAGL